MRKIFILGFVTSVSAFSSTTRNHNNRASSSRHYGLQLHQGKNKNEEVGRESGRVKKCSASRRRLLQTSTASVISALFVPNAANLANAAMEIDSKTGEMFTSKSKMLAGGSDVTRGTKSTKKDRRNIEIYNTRFISYLARFLIVFDASAGDFWASKLATKGKTDPGVLFAQFAESVEIGLYDYFSGPYGSYSTVQAAKAGISSIQPQKSMTSSETKLAKQGVLNLLALLKARYQSEECKRQLAILFCFLVGDLQPKGEIRRLLAEADNASVSGIIIADSGFGYAYNESPKVSVDSPPAIGNEYHVAKFEPVLNNTGLITSIDVVESGSGYISPPDVTIVDKGGNGRGAEACAILDRNGQVEEIIVLNQGKNYVEPIVRIISPAKSKSKLKIVHAKAKANLSYAVGSIRIIDGGDGYSLSDVPALKIEPPLNTLDLLAANRTFYEVNAAADGKAASAQISKMQSSSEYVNEKQVTPIMLADIAKSCTKLLPNAVRPSPTSDGTYKVRGMPAPPVYGGFFGEQLPEGFKALDPIFGGVGATPVVKVALSLSTSEYTRLASAGAISTILVRTMLVPLEVIKTKIQLGSDTEFLEAAESSPSTNNAPRKKEKNYVPVDFTESGSTLVAIEKIVETDNHVDPDRDKTSVGTLKYIQTLADLRGVPSLFQSADITFLASLVFGSFGFGTTELFRRTFTSTFYDETTAVNGTQTYIFLAAATVACILTCLVATPFEVLRVKSMARVENSGINRVLGDYMDSHRNPGTSDFANASLYKQLSDFDIKLDFLPFYTSFIPVVTRELPFSITKFLAFDFFAKIICAALPINVQVGVGTAGLCVSAISGAFAGVAGALVSHPADLLLTLTSGSSKVKGESSSDSEESNGEERTDFGKVVKDLISQDGGVLNLFVGLPARSTFFFFVIGLQFFLYDYAKNVFGVGSDDLNLVLDVFYAVRQGLLESG